MSIGERPTAPPGPGWGAALGPTPPIAHRSAGRARLWGAAAAVAIVGILIGAGFALGWYSQSPKSGPPGTCPTGVTLQGEGASFVLPLMSQWEISYQSNSSNAVNYNDAGAGAGISALTARSVDFAVTDEPLTSAEYRALPGTVLTLPATAGALAIIYNLPGVTTPIQLSGSVLAQVYLGTITNWNASALRALNPGVPLPSQTIVTVHRSDAAGTTYVLTNYLSEDSANWSAGPGTGIQPSWPAAPAQQAEQGNSKVVQYVQKTAYTIGYADLTDVLGAPGLQYARMENPSQRFLLPTLADTASAIADVSRNTTFPAASAAWTNVSMVNSQSPGDYPLATFSYFLVFQAADAGFQPSLLKTEALAQFLDWALSQGQDYSANLYYVTLPSGLVALDESAIATITFDGNAVSCSTH